MRLARWLRVPAALAIVSLIGGLMVMAAPAALTQSGTNNYIGPGPCPGQDWDCIITGGDIEGGLQEAPSGGQNVVDCRGATCDVTQRGAAPGDKPTNSAECTNTTGAGTSSQLCRFNQQGGTNTIEADLTASPSTSGILLANVSQRSEQRFITTQDGDTNNLVVKGTINQQATSTLGASIPVTHNQQTLQLSQNAMTATTSNVADYQLNRTQASNATGASPTQLQDSNGALGLGKIDLVANSGGTSSIKINGNDTKTQGATALVGNATQTQGHPEGGWLAKLEVDSAQPSGLDIDVGEPGSQTEGLVKVWKQHAEVGLFGSKNQLQDDAIKIPLIGSSPFAVRSNSFCDLETDEGGTTKATQEASGHAKTNWTGQLACTLKAGDKVQNPVVPFSAKDVNVSLFCQINQDECPGGEVFPASHAHLAVRNVDTGEGFDSDEFPSGTSAEPEEVIEYRAVFHNDGDAESVATDGTLSLPVPSGTTFLGCSDGCLEDGGTATWNLGDVPGETELSRTLQVQVDPEAGPGDVTTTASGSDQLGDFQSNVATLTITEIVEEIEDVEIQISGTHKKSGVIPVAILTTDAFDATTVNPDTVCFGTDPFANPPACTNWSPVTDSIKDVNGDGRDDLFMHFAAQDTGISPNDQTACLTGETYEGTRVHGCGPLPKGNK